MSSRKVIKSSVGRSDLSLPLHNPHNQGMDTLGSDLPDPPKHKRSYRRWTPCFCCKNLESCVFPQTSPDFQAFPLINFDKLRTNKNGTVFYHNENQSDRTPSEPSETDNSCPGFTKSSTLLEDPEEKRDFGQFGTRFRPENPTPTALTLRQARNKEVDPIERGTHPQHFEEASSQQNSRFFPKFWTWDFWRGSDESNKKSEDINIPKIIEPIEETQSRLSDTCPNQVGGDDVSRLGTGLSWTDYFTKSFQSR